MKKFLGYIAGFLIVLGIALSLCSHFGHDVKSHEFAFSVLAHASPADCAIVVRERYDIRVEHYVPVSEMMASVAINSSQHTRGPPTTILS